MARHAYAWEFIDNNYQRNRSANTQNKTCQIIKSGDFNETPYIWFTWHAEFSDPFYLLWYLFWFNYCFFTSIAVEIFLSNFLFQPYFFLILEVCVGCLLLLVEQCFSKLSYLFFISELYWLHEFCEEYNIIVWTIFI